MDVLKSSVFLSRLLTKEKIACSGCAGRLSLRAKCDILFSWLLGCFRAAKSNFHGKSVQGAGDEKRGRLVFFSTGFEAVAIEKNKVERGQGRREKSTRREEERARAFLSEEGLKKSFFFEE